MGHETRNDCAGEGQQQFAALLSLRLQWVNYEFKILSFMTKIFLYCEGLYSYLQIFARALHAVCCYLCHLFSHLFQMIKLPALLAVFIR
jgi:hypothetical protein